MHPLERPPLIVLAILACIAGAIVSGFLHHWFVAKLFAYAVAALCALMLLMVLAASRNR